MRKSLKRFTKESGGSGCVGGAEERKESGAGKGKRIPSSVVKAEEEAKEKVIQAGKTASNDAKKRWKRLRDIRKAVEWHHATSGINELIDRSEERIKAVTEETHCNNEVAKKLEGEANEDSVITNANEKLAKERIEKHLKGDYGKGGKELKDAEVDSTLKKRDSKIVKLTKRDGEIATMLFNRIPKNSNGVITIDACVKYLRQCDESGAFLGLSHHGRHGDRDDELERIFHEELGKSSRDTIVLSDFLQFVYATHGFLATKELERRSNDSIEDSEGAKSSGSSFVFDDDKGSNFSKNEKTIEVEKKIFNLFKTIDSDHSGYLTKKEVGELAQKMGDKLTTLFWHKKLDEAFAEMDPNDDSLVTLKEFISWHHRNHPTQSSHVHEQIKYLFKKIDANQDGKLDRNEVKLLLGKTGNRITKLFSFHSLYGEGKKSFDEAFQEMDESGTGVVTLKEFMTWHCKEHKIEEPLSYDDEGVDTIFPVLKESDDDDDNSCNNDVGDEEENNDDSESWKIEHKILKQTSISSLLLPLHLAAGTPDKSDVVKYLVENENLSVDEQHPPVPKFQITGATPIMFALQSSCIKSFEYLLKQNCNVMIEDAYGYDVISHACRDRNIDPRCIQLLLQYRPNLSDYLMKKIEKYGRNDLILEAFPKDQNRNENVVEETIQFSNNDGNGKERNVEFPFPQSKSQESNNVEEENRITVESLSSPINQTTSEKKIQSILDERKRLSSLSLKKSRRNLCHFANNEEIEDVKKIKSLQPCGCDDDNDALLRQYRNSRSSVYSRNNKVLREKPTFSNLQKLEKWVISGKPSGTALYEKPKHSAALPQSKMKTWHVLEKLLHILATTHARCLVCDILDNRSKDEINEILKGKKNILSFYLKRNWKPWSKISTPSAEESHYEEKMIFKNGYEAIARELQAAIWSFVESRQNAAIQSLLNAIKYASERTMKERENLFQQFHIIGDHYDKVIEYEGRIEYVENCIRKVKERVSQLKGMYESKNENEKKMINATKIWSVTSNEMDTVKNAQEQFKKVKSIHEKLQFVQQVEKAFRNVRNIALEEQLRVAKRKAKTKWVRKVEEAIQEFFRLFLLMKNEMKNINDDLEALTGLEKSDHVSIISSMPSNKGYPSSFSIVHDKETDCKDNGEGDEEAPTEYVRVFNDAKRVYKEVKELNEFCNQAEMRRSDLIFSLCKAFNIEKSEGNENDEVFLQGIIQKENFFLEKEQKSHSDLLQDAKNSIRATSRLRFKIHKFKNIFEKSIRVIRRDTEACKIENENEETADDDTRTKVLHFVQSHFGKDHKKLEVLQLCNKKFLQSQHTKNISNSHFHSHHHQQIKIFCNCKKCQYIKSRLQKQGAEEIEDMKVQMVWEDDEDSVH
eukprot:g4425.t1